MFVLACGMPRSGSTLSYNIIREALLMRGTVSEVSAFALSDALAAANSDHLVNKAHSVDDETVALIKCGALRVVCTIRRPEDAVASWQHTFGFDLDQSIESFRWWFRLYERIRHAALIVDFDAIERRPTRTTWAIGRYLFGDYSPVEALRISSKYKKETVRKMTASMQRSDPNIVDLGRTFHDRTTMFHRSHISSIRLPVDRTISERVRGDLCEWVDEDGEIRNLHQSNARRHDAR